MSYTEKTWMLLFILMTEFGHGFTDMHEQIEKFCSCWRSFSTCEGQTLSLIIDLIDCPKTFPWESRRTRTTTDFHVLIKYNGTNILNRITCYRLQENKCKHPIIPFFWDNIQTPGITIEVGPKCNMCSCRPIIRYLSPCNEHVGAILPKPTTQSPEEESYNFVPITIGLSVTLIGILALLFCLHKKYRHSFKAGRLPKIESGEDYHHDLCRLPTE